MVLQMLQHLRAGTAPGSEDQAAVLQLSGEF